MLQEMNKWNTTRKKKESKQVSWSIHQANGCFTITIQSQQAREEDYNGIIKINGNTAIKNECVEVCDFVIKGKVHYSWHKVYSDLDTL